MADRKVRELLNVDAMEKRAQLSIDAHLAVGRTPAQSLYDVLKLVQAYRELTNVAKK
jgi:hypothetical protein